MIVWRPKTSHARHIDGDWKPLAAEVEALRTVEEVDAFWTRFLLDRHRNYPEPWSLALRDLCAAKRDELSDLEDRVRQLDAEMTSAMERDR